VTSFKSVYGDFRSDVDVLLCDPERPHEAAAFEIKRIKFGLSAFRADRSVVPNKLRAVEKAIAQANRVAQVGFWKEFLYIIVVVDSRGRNAGGGQLSIFTFNHIIERGLRANPDNFGSNVAIIHLLRLLDL
jgi:hypothetical protein